MDLKIKILRKSNEINKKSWDELANFMFLKTDFLEIIENLELGKEAYYFEIYDNDDLMGVFVAYPQFKSLYHNLEETIYGKFSFILKKFFKLSPSLLCNFPYSPFHQMFAIKDTKNKGEIFSFFLINLKKITFENSYKTCGVLSIRNEIFLEESKKNNFIQVFSGFNLYYDINWNSFDDFKKSFPRSKRYMINREKKQFESSGSKFEIVKKENLYFEKISELFKNNFKKYNMPIEDKISSEFIKAFEKKDEMNFFIIKNSLNEIIASI
ncbi:hypothetical protein EOM09_09025, partial [bacterium]|nr:hypothetical protein [bacterium]